MTEAIKNYGRIGVLMGGVSSERKISLKSGQAIINALHKSGCQIIPLDIVNKDKDKISSFIFDAKIEIAFIALHGQFGEDGGIQNILENLNIAYTGSGVKASRLTLNKVSTQNFLKKNGINVPNFVSLSRGKDVNCGNIVDQLGRFPYVVKPAMEGSSIGISFVKNENELRRAIENSWQYGDEILIDQCIVNGREMTVGILQEKALPVVEIRPKCSYFDFTAKYQKGMTDYIVPAEISKELTEKLKEIAEKVHLLTECRGFSRVDFIIDENNIPYVLEINTIPGFTQTSLLPKAALEAGIDFTKLCLKIVELAYGKKKEVQNITCSI